MMTNHCHAFAEIKMHEYKSVILKWIDGDTVDVDIDLGFDCWLHRQRIRLNGVDTPESRTRDLEEKKYGLQAKEFVQSFAPVGSEVTLRTTKKGKYGRYLGDIKSGRKWICRELVKAHHAVEYHGQSKADIKQAHLENRRLLNGKGNT
jgi:micrococcal nuclease